MQIKNFYLQDYLNNHDILIIHFWSTKSYETFFIISLIFQISVIDHFNFYFFFKLFLII